MTFELISIKKVKMVVGDYRKCNSNCVSKEKNL